MKKIISNKKLSSLVVLLFFSMAAMAQPGTLSLKDAINYALKNKADVAKAALNVEDAQYQIDETKAARLPQISGSAGITYNPLLQKTALPGELSGQPGKTTLLALGQKWSVNPGVSVSQKIYDPALTVSIKSKQINKAYYQLSAAVTDEQVIENVATSYYQVLIDRQKIEVVDSNLVNNLQAKEIIKSKYDNGLAKKIDLDRVTVNISNLRTQKQQLLNNVELQENTLKFYMGMSVDSTIAMPQTLKNIYPQASLLTDSLDVASLNQYKLLEKQHEFLINSKLQVQKAYLPTVSFSGNLNYQGIGNKFPVFSGSSSGTNWFAYSSVGVTLSVPLFNGGATKARVKQANVKIRSLEQDMQNTSLSLAYEFNNAKIQIKNSLATLKSQQENIALAQEVFFNTKNNYMQGLATLTDLLDAQKSLTESQTNYSSALLDYKLAELQSIKSKGQLKSLLN